MPDEPLVLGIETSCDETGVGIVRGHTLLADALASSVDEHARFGGVVPEVAIDNHPAQKLYATYGFEPVGIRRGYYQPSNTDALVMMRDV